jgi:hypothetical protein
MPASWRRATADHPRSGIEGVLVTSILSEKIDQPEPALPVPGIPLFA